MLANAKRHALWALLGGCVVAASFWITLVLLERYGSTEVTVPWDQVRAVLPAKIAVLPAGSSVFLFATLSGASDSYVDLAVDNQENRFISQFAFKAHPDPTYANEIPVRVVVAAGNEFGKPLADRTLATMNRLTYDSSGKSAGTAGYGVPIMSSARNITIRFYQSGVPNSYNHGYHLRMYEPVLRVRP
jgi:hypothetical protein